MKDLTILRNDLRSYFLNVKDYLKSGGDATICAAKENCRFACFGSLPWGVSSTKFSQVLDWVPGSWNIESQIDYCVEWVENELRKKISFGFCIIIQIFRCSGAEVGKRPCLLLLFH